MVRRAVRRSACVVALSDKEESKRLFFSMRSSALPHKELFQDTLAVKETKKPERCCIN